MASGITLLHHKNFRLKRALANPPHSEQSSDLRAENLRLKNQLEQAIRDRDGKATLEARQADLLRARIEVTELEKRAMSQRSEMTERTARAQEKLAQNRDPTHGLVRLDHFQNSGQATPVAAFETLLWATLQGDEATMKKVTTMSAETRAQAEKFIAELPDEMRAKWSPEKLAALLVTDLVTQYPAMQVSAENHEDPEHATLFVSGPETDQEKLKLKLSPSGWKFVIPGSALAKLQKRLRAEAK
jgi:hypothetical protein